MDDECEDSDFDFYEGDVLDSGNHQNSAGIDEDDGLDMEEADDEEEDASVGRAGAEEVYYDQQQQQQQQQPHAPRRSGRPNKGTMSATFAATHGPVAGPSQGAPSEPGGRGGRGNRSQRKSQQQLPATPTQPAAPTSRRKGRKGRRTP